MNKERTYLDLMVSDGYTNEMEQLGQYLHVLGQEGLTLHHRTYSTSQEDNDFLEWENNQLDEVFVISVAEEKGKKEEVFSLCSVSRSNFR